MNTILEKNVGTKEKVDFSSVMVIYETPTGTQRGFVVPFDLTYEADTKNEVQTVLKDMIASYVDALEIYKSPKHLADLPLSDKDDETKWSRISWDIFIALKKGVSKIERPDYYAEAQLPA